MKYNQSEGGGARNGLLNPCARLLVGLARTKVSSFFLSSFFLLSFFFLRTGARSSAREIYLGATLGGGPGLGSEWAQGGLGGLAVGLQWACSGLAVGLVGFWWAFGVLLVGFLVGFCYAFARLLPGFCRAFARYPPTPRYCTGRLRAEIHSAFRDFA